MTSDPLAGLFSATSPRPEAREVVHATDGVVSVWNYDSGMGEARPDWTTTVRWSDARGLHDAVFDEESGRLGWVEAVGAFLTRAGAVYLLVSEDKLGALRYATLLTAFRVERDRLVAVRGFFPPGLPGANAARSAVAWEYRRRAGGSVFPRPVEVRLDEGEGRVAVHVLDGRECAEFSLELRGDGLVAVGLAPAVAAALAPFVGR